MARKYVFQELYDSTRTVAKQIAEKNKYQITGQYKATRNDEIQLGAMNIPRGSVIVTAGGQTLMEGSDYTVDYNSGVVRILNKSILDAGTNVNVSLESNTDYGMQRKTMFGMNFEYDFSKDFQLVVPSCTSARNPLRQRFLWGLSRSTIRCGGLICRGRSKASALPTGLTNCRSYIVQHHQALISLPNLPNS